MVRCSLFPKFLHLSKKRGPDNAPAKYRGPILPNNYLLSEVAADRCQHPNLNNRRNLTLAACRDYVFSVSGVRRKPDEENIVRNPAHVRRISIIRVYLCTIPEQVAVFVSAFVIVVVETHGGHAEFWQCFELLRLLNA